ncbi:MAG: HD domain-containing protein [FCB group bacterium]|nr:HD domain-containing protein [FCB group bacterium]
MKPITPINKFKDGDSIQGFFLCVEKHPRYTRAGDLYLDLVLRDRTGQIAAKIWDKVASLSAKFSAGDPVAVAGEVESFQDRLQLIVKRINRATVQSYGRYGYDPALIVPAAEQDPKEMWKEIKASIRKIRDPHLRSLVTLIYRQNKKQLLTHPASVKMHHNYRSGFLEHVLSMARVGLAVAPLYHVNQDLLLAGIFLHDIGKLREITPGYEFSYTDEGNFLGHIVISRDMILKGIEELKSFPAELGIKLEHMILAHQGQYEWQSPKKPAFKEALLLHLIDNLDAKMNLMDRALKEDQEEGNWTARRNYFRIPLFKGNTDHQN